MKLTHKTRLHSSRMHTARLLIVSPSMHCAGRGVSAPGGALSQGEGCLLPLGGGRLVWGGLLWGRLLRGVCSRGGSAPGGVCSRGVGIPACTEAEADPPPMDRITDTCKHITFANFVCGRL